MRSFIMCFPTVIYSMMTTHNLSKSEEQWVHVRDGQRLLSGVSEVDRGHVEHAGHCLFSSFFLMLSLLL